MRKKSKPEKIDKALKRLEKELEDDPLWQEWVGSGGPEFLERAAKELDEIKPSLEEMLLDLVEAGWRLENPDGDFGLLAKKKKDVITALWKLTQVIQGHFKSDQVEKKEWRKRLDG